MNLLKSVGLGLTSRMLDLRGGGGGGGGGGGPIFLFILQMGMIGTTDVFKEPSRVRVIAAVRVRDDRMELVWLERQHGWCGDSCPLRLTCDISLISY